MADKAPDWALPELFRLSEQDFEGPDFSKLILLVLRRLDAAFPNLIDLTTCMKIVTHIEEFTQLWEWLQQQGIVNGPISNCTLTLSGKRSFNATLEQMPALGSRFMKAEAGIEGEEASELLLSIMKHHFRAFGGLPENR
ncbi:MAG: hypothetical protein HKN05_08395 [Rhizobiales bacterium]|nr:hypothetical protein [Hyphomicrobiales bacterium]